MCPGISEVGKFLGLDRYGIYTQSICEYSHYVDLVFNDCNYKVWLGFQFGKKWSLTCIRAVSLVEFLHDPGLFNLAISA